MDLATAQRRLDLKASANSNEIQAAYLAACSLLWKEMAGATLEKRRALREQVKELGVAREVLLKAVTAEPPVFPSVPQVSSTEVPDLPGARPALNTAPSSADVVAAQRRLDLEASANSIEIQAAYDAARSRSWKQANEATTRDELILLQAQRHELQHARDILMRAATPESLEPLHPTIIQNESRHPDSVQSNALELQKSKPPGDRSLVPPRSFTETSPRHESGSDGSLGVLKELTVAGLIIAGIYWLTTIEWQSEDDARPAQESAEQDVRAHVRGLLSRLKLAIRDKDYLEIVAITSRFEELGLSESNPRMAFLRGMAHVQLGDHDAGVLYLNRYLSSEHTEYVELARELIAVTENKAGPVDQAPDGE